MDLFTKNNIQMFCKSLNQIKCLDDFKNIASWNSLTKHLKIIIFLLINKSIMFLIAGGSVRLSDVWNIIFWNYFCGEIGFSPKYVLNRLIYLMRNRLEKEFDRINWQVLVIKIVKLSWQRVWKSVKIIKYIKLLNYLYYHLF